MPVTKKLPVIPTPDVPLINPSTGRMSFEWYQFLSQLIVVLEEMRGLIP